jgi:hypothetical protein
LDIPPKLVLVPAGSRTLIKDRFSVPSLQEYPLFLKAGDRQKYVTALQMLQDTIFHSIQHRGRKGDVSADLLELAEALVVRELSPNS